MRGEMDAAEQPRRLLGLLLIEMGLISEEQLVAALAEQDRTGVLLGEILIAQGHAARLAIQDALARQHGALIQPDPGFGSGLRGELVRREMRREPSLERHPLGSSGVAPTALGQTLTNPLDQSEQTEPELGRAVRRLAAELERHESRLIELEHALAEARHDLAVALRRLSAKVAAVPVPANEPSAPFLAAVGRAQDHLTARRAALRRRDRLVARR